MDDTRLGSTDLDIPEPHKAVPVPSAHSLPDIRPTSEVDADDPPEPLLLIDVDNLSEGDKSVSGLSPSENRKFDRSAFTLSETVNLLYKVVGVEWWM